MKKAVLFLFLSSTVCLLSCSLPLKSSRGENTEVSQPPPTQTTQENAVKETPLVPKREINPPQPLPPEIKRNEEIKLTSLELQKYAYELGFDPKKELTQEQKQQILNRKKLRQLERTLDSQKERIQYSKVLPWLHDDTEKIEMLAIPTIEGRQVWINKNKIWSRAKNLKNFEDVVAAQDIAIGMPSDYVKKSWGEPDSIEISGNPIYKNERWQYSKQVATPQGYKQEKRYVYFEGGRVVGWETE